MKGIIYTKLQIIRYIVFLKIKKKIVKAFLNVKYKKKHLQRSHRIIIVRKLCQRSDRLWEFWKYIIQNIVANIKTVVSYE